MSDANERIATLKEALVVAAKDAAAWQANALEMERERDEARAELSRKKLSHESTRNLAKRKSSEAIAFKEQRDALATAVDAAIECGIVPKVGTPTAGAAYYERQNDVADMLRDALVKSKGGKP